ncbi:expressed unknown protein (Partial), partial [Seminavis robusta]|eukprot:Sro1947_g307100.1 n/a (427) ;mRNA; r:2-1282
MIDKTKRNNVASLEAAIPLNDDGGFIPLQLPLEEGEGLLCLGVPPNSCYLESFESCIDADSVYGDLPRPAFLPGCCPVSGPAEGASNCQELVEGFWHGDFAFKFEADVPKTTKDTLSICAWVRSEESEDINAAVKLVFGFENGRTIFRHVFSDRIQFQLSKEELQLLACRVLHQFLRQFGWMLPWTFLSAMFSTLSFVLATKTSRLSELLDLCIVRTDLMLHIIAGFDDAKAIGAAMSEIGRALESAGRCNQAGDLYVEIAKEYIASNVDLKAQAYSSAGKAFLKAQACDAALQHLLIGLQVLASGNALEWNSQASAGIIANLVLLHQEVHTKSLESRRGQATHDTTSLTDEEKLFPAVACLLVKAGFDPLDQPAAAFRIQGQGQSSMCMDRLKPELKKRKQARQLLMRLFRSGSVDSYKDGLVSAM